MGVTKNTLFPFEQFSKSLASTSQNNSETQVVAAATSESNSVGQDAGIIIAKQSN